MDYTVHGILQVRILEWVAFPFSRGSSQPRINPGLPYSRWILYQLSCQGSLNLEMQFANKGPHSQSCGFSSTHVQIWELDHKESWALKNWWFQTVVFEKILESYLHSKEIKPVHPKEDQLPRFIGRTDSEAEALILWPPDAKSWLIGKDHGAGKDWWQKETGVAEDEMVR